MQGLLVNVAQLLKEPVGSKRILGVDTPWGEQEDQPATSYVRGKLTLTRTDKGVWAHVPLEAAADVVCGRCTASFMTWVDFTIDEEYLPTVDVTTGSRVHYADENADEAFFIDPHHTLDLTEAVRQYSIAATPMAVACRPECLGLCPTCGADLNLGPCACPTEVDLRWAGLKRILR